jgi:hypothetical protein
MGSDGSLDAIELKLRSKEPRRKRRGFKDNVNYQILHLGAGIEPTPRWLIHPHRKRWGIVSIFVKRGDHEAFARHGRVVGRPACADIWLRQGFRETTATPKTKL